MAKSRIALGDSCMVMLSDGSNITGTLNPNYYYGYLAKMVELAINKVTMVVDSKYMQPNNGVQISAYSTVLVLDPNTGQVSHHCPRTTQSSTRYKMPSMNYLKIAQQSKICELSLKGENLKIVLR